MSQTNAPNLPPMRWLDTFALRLLAGWCVLLALIWAGLGYDYTRVRNARLEKAHAQASGVAKSMEERVVRTVRTVEMVLRVAAQTIQRRAPHGEVAIISDVLHGLDPQFDELLTLSFDNAAGVSMVNTNPQIASGLNYGDRDFFQIHRDQPEYGPFISGPMVGPASGRRVFLISHRINGHDGQFLGVLVASVSTDALAAKFAGERVGELGALSLLHIPSRSTLLQQPGYEATFGQRVQNAKVFDALQQAPSGSWDSQGLLDEVPRQFVYRRLADLPLVLNVGVSTAEIEAQLHADLLNSWLVVVILTLATGAAGLAILLEHRKQLHMRQAVLATGQQLQAIIDTTPGCVKRVSREGILLSMNAAGLAMIEAQDASEVIGRSIYRLICAPYQEKFREFNAMVCNGEPGELEFEVVGLRGTRRWLVTRAVPFMQQGSMQWEHLAVTLDITAQKQAQDDLRLAASVYNHSGEAMMVTDAQRSILSVNPAFSLLTGYAAEEVVGQRARIYQGPQFDAAFDHAVWLHLQRNGHWQGEAQGRRKSGELYPQWLDIAAIKDGQGEVTRYIALHSDISERQKGARALQKLNEALGQSRQTLRALAAQSDAAREEERKHIAREVHDELGQTLTALRLDISLLGMRSENMDDALARKIVSMKALVDRAIQGVRNVTTNLRPTALDMGLESAIEWLCVDFTERSGIPCHLHIDTSFIELDESRCVVVFRIVQESLTNVVRYANASEVHIRLAVMADQLVVEVQDNGRGFDPVLLANKKSFGMLGMRERALALGGNVHVSSVPGRGCVVALSIPLALNNKEIGE